MAEQKKMTAKEVIQEKQSNLMNGIAKWVSFYRANPQRFCKDYLNVHLRLFQKILIYAMMHNYFFCFIASRGLGKTYLVALFCVVRCILYPSTKIVVASATRPQANETLLKIKDDFCKNNEWGSENLRNEISNISVGQANAIIEFKNGSFITVATASDSGRGKRGNILICDEFRMIDLDVIQNVLRRFLTAPRQPAYLSKPKYVDRKDELTERNLELYMSSAWYQSHYSYDLCKTYTANMLDGRKYFICSLPYQIALKEGLLKRDAIEDEMSEVTFDPIKWSIEMGALFYGDTDGAFFTYEDLAKRRKIKNAFYPLGAYKDKDKDNIPKLLTNEKRILSVDVALLASKKHDNDASALIINSAIPTNDNKLVSNIVFMETYEGLTTDELGLIIMRTFYKYHCTDLVLDTNGLGLGCFDYVIKDQYDASTGDTYKAMTCINDTEMAERCKVRDANKVIWSVKATANFNNEICILLRNGIQNGKINLLVSDFEADEVLKDNIKGFIKLDPREQAMYKVPFTQTSLLINELINLEHEIKGTNIKIKEKSGMRKDRYSSLAYNYWCACQLELKNKKKSADVKTLVSRLPVTKGVRHSLF